MEINKIYTGKMEDVVKQFPDNFFDSCVTDPPYGIRFMGKKWDYEVPAPAAFSEILRVLKPGAHILVACGTRTQHRMAVNIEDAGFEIRDVICWHYAQGFPKSRNISKDMDDEAGAESKVVGKREHPTLKDKSKVDRPDAGGFHGENGIKDEWDITAPETELAKEWEGWGTALKPATEFWTLARKPIVESTVAKNVIEHGTGAINIDACRVETDDEITNHSRSADSAKSKGKYGDSAAQETHQTPGQAIGRWPPNAILDEFMGEEMDKQSGQLTSGKPIGVRKAGNNIYGDLGTGQEITGYGDTGGASRFFYCAKPDSFERSKGLDKFAKKAGGFRSNTSGQHLTRRDGGDPEPQANYHPTVKPIALMRWLVKLITPKGGTVLDPYCGSGSTLIGAKLEMKNWLGIEMEPDYCEIAEARVKAWNPDQYIPQQLF